MQEGHVIDDMGIVGIKADICESADRKPCELSAVAGGGDAAGPLQRAGFLPGTSAAQPVHQH